MKTELKNGIKVVPANRSPDLASQRNQVALEVAPENAEAVGFLSELISDSLGRLDSLKRSASTAILDVLENSVRLGWYLDDSRQFLIKEKSYIAWVEQTFPISYGYSVRLRQLARHFCRDGLDNDQRRRLGIQIKGLDEIGEHLRRQITQTQSNSISDLFRFAGLLPSPASTGTNGSNGTNGEHPPEKIVDKLKATIKAFKNQTARVDLSKLSTADRERLIADFRPLIAFYSQLKNAAD
jgi:hypothetical protein